MGISPSPSGGMSVPSGLSTSNASTVPISPSVLTGATTIFAASGSTPFKKSFTVQVPQPSETLVVAPPSPFIPSQGNATEIISLINGTNLPFSFSSIAGTVNEEFSITPESSLLISWSECNVTCGGGVQIRKCGQNETLDIDSECFNKIFVQRPCNNDPCNCRLTQKYLQKQLGDILQTNPIGWIEKDGKTGWTSVNENVLLNDTIETGVVIHINCNNCTCENGNISCVKKKCNENCKYTNWLPWSDCTKTCDNGVKKRYRFKLYGDCTLPTNETLNCNIDVCKSEWTTWSSWSRCDPDVPCSFGKQQRSRKCMSSNNKLKTIGCVGRSLETKLCNSKSCPNKNCTNKKIWFDCKTKTKSCPITCMDNQLPESCTENDDCTPGCHCPDGLVDYNGQCIKPSQCPCYESNGKVRLPGFEVRTENICQSCICQKNGTVKCYKNDSCCLFQHWTEWSECKNDCGKGLKTRFRKLDSKQSYNCSLKDKKEEAECFGQKCEPQCIINNVKYRNGDVISSTKCTTCSCLNNEKICTNIVVNGKWSLWSQWSECNSNCTGGTRQRNRTCSNPFPSCNGTKCFGENMEKEKCNGNVSCCEVTQWNRWSDCSSKCGMGQKNRTRNFKTEKDSKFCKVELKQVSNCTSDPCNKKCNLSKWSVWSPCSVSCGQGTKARERNILNKDNENDCPKNLREEETCIEKNCKCIGNEIWVEDGCEKNCDDVKQCKIAACICKNGWKRSNNDSCIPENICNLCNINGEEKQPGSIWNNPKDECEKCECVGGQKVCSRVCQIPKCKKGEELSYDVLNKCCPVCVNKSVCTLKYATSYLIDSLTGCQSKNKVTYSYCEGYCGSSSEKPVLMNLRNSSSSHQKCVCCQGVASSPKSIDVFCESKNTTKTGYYSDMKSCGCQECSNS